MRLAGVVWLAVAAGVATVQPVLAQQAAPAAVVGTAVDRERMALAPGAVFEATLEDVSRPGASATVLGTARVDNVNAVPIRFAVAYDPKAIEATHTYAVRGRILVDGKLALTTDTTYPVQG